MEKKRALPPPNNNKNNNPTLDLHGYRKDEAIRAVTAFLDRHRNNNNNKAVGVWVTIITGSGSHSPAGPVLRTAVESLLTRRQFEFVRHTPGSLLVQAQSGVVWYAQQESAVDTKVVTVAAANANDDPNVHWQNQKHNQQRRRRRQILNQKMPAQRSNSGHDSEESHVSGPSVTEVAADEAAMAEVIRSSRDMAIEHYRQGKRAAKADLERALQESAALMYKTTHNDDDDDDFDESLQRVLRQSQHEEERRITEEEALLQRALDASTATPTTLTDEQVEALTQQALALSLQQQSHDNNNDEEQQLIQEILQRSLRETVGP